MIKNFKKKSGLAAVCAVMLAMVLGVGASVIRVYGMAPRQGDLHEVGDIARHSTSDDNIVFNLQSRSGQLNISESGSFLAEDNQILTLRYSSSIRGGGTVDLFLFAPDGTEHRFTIGRTLTTIRQIELTEGVWTYNVSGIFRDGGDISIVGTVASSEAYAYLPLVNDGDVFELHIPIIPVDDEVLVGRLILEPGQSVHVSVNAEGGRSIFLGAETPEFRWSPFSAGNSEAEFTINYDGIVRYLFVGSCRIRGNQADLTNVTVRLTMLSNSPPNAPSQAFTPPSWEGRGGHYMRYVEKNDLTAFEGHGITVNRGNIYYSGQLARRVIFYTSHSFQNNNGFIVFLSADKSGEIEIYVQIPGTPHSISGSDIDNFTRIDVVEIKSEDVSIITNGNGA